MPYAVRILPVDARERQAGEAFQERGTGRPRFGRSAQSSNSRIARPAILPWRSASVASLMSSMA